MAAYSEIDSATSLNGTSVWTDGTSYPIYLPFSFSVYGQAYTAINVMAGGGINFPGLGYKQLNVWWVAFAGGFYLEDKGTTTSLSPISYSITGGTGAHVLKVQWKNAGFKQVGDSVVSSDFVDYQIWLFEADNHMELHFGASSTSIYTYGGPGSADGTELILEYDACNDMFAIEGPANLPSYAFVNYCSPTATFLDGTPDSGIVYGIVPNLLAINQLQDGKQDLVLSPNPCSDILDVGGLPSNTVGISIINSLGRECDFTAVNAGTKNLSIPIQQFPSGVYFLKCALADGTRYFRKFIKD